LDYFNSTFQCIHHLRQYCDLQAILAPLKKEREAQEKAAAEEILAQEKAIEDAKLAQEKTVEDMKIANEAGSHPETITVPEETIQGSI
jgi:hypothetical protein